MLTLKQFAKEVNLTPQTISRYIRRKLLKPRRLPSGQPYFLPEDVERFKEGQFQFGEA